MSRGSVLVLRSLVAPLLLIGVFNGACADEPVPGATQPPPPEQCPIDEKARFKFTSVERVFGDPTLCKMEPETLNAQVDAGAEACVITPKADCRADVVCQVSGLNVSGEVAALEEGIFGDFDVTIEGLGKVCGFSVEATLN